MKKIILPLVAFIIILFYFVVFFNNHKKSNQITLKNHVSSYIAMGDSVAAGLGTGNYIDASACDRSSKSYPVILAHDLGMKLIDLACSGAKLSSGVLGSQTVNDLALPSQLSVLESQSTRPKIITITIGANDINWTHYLSECYKAVCDSPQNTASINQSENILSSQLTTLFSDLKQFYKNTLPTVYLTSYYQTLPLSPINSCSDMTNLSSNDLVWINQELTSLNNVLQQATINYSFVQYIPVNFAGHQLCENNTWIQGLTNTAPFHPNSLGQLDYAKAIVAKYSAK